MDIMMLAKRDGSPGETDNRSKRSQEVVPFDRA
jgi:hypothetical protein